MPSRSLSSRAVLAAAAAIGCLALAACSSAAAAGPAAEEPAPAAYPITVDNCGFDLTVESAPERIVSIKSSTFELLLALGLSDRIVGYAFPDGPVPEELAADAAGIPLLSDKVQSLEGVLAVEPDFLFAGWESNLTADAAGERGVLAGLGVGTYVAPAACKGVDYMPNPLTFDDVFDSFTEAGEIFDARDSAAALVESQRAALAAISPDPREWSAVWYSSGDDSPFVGAGIGAPQMIMDAAGLTNAFGEVADTWTSASWESVVERDPDVLVLVDSTWNTAASKIERLESDPVASQLTAVRERRYLIVDFPASEAGVRNVQAVESIVEQLADL